MEKNNNNGRGIFYGVIGVATLVVAIVGATFAYFSASITQTNAIANIASTTVNLTFTEEGKNFKTDLIPVQTTGDGVMTFNHDNSDATDPITAFAEFPGFTTTEGASKDACRDLIGNDICSVYTFTIANPSSSTSQTVTGSMMVTINGNGTNTFSNLKYALFKGNGTTNTGTGRWYYDVNATTNAVDGDEVALPGNFVAGNLTGNGTVAGDGTLIYKGTFGAAGTTTNWLTTTQLLGTTSATNSITYTMVIWLEEAGASNQNEQGLPFAASITFKSPEGQGVTGMIVSS